MGRAGRDDERIKASTAQVLSFETDALHPAFCAVAVRVPTADPEPGSVLQGSHGVEVHEVGESNTEVCHSRIASSLVVQSC